MYVGRFFSLAPNTRHTSIYTKIEYGKNEWIITDETISSIMKKIGQQEKPIKDKEPTRFELMDL